MLVTTPLPPPHRSPVVGVASVCYYNALLFYDLADLCKKDRYLVDDTGDGALVELSVCRAAGRIDCALPLEITYTEQKSGAALFIMVATSGIQNLTT